MSLIRRICNHFHYPHSTLRLFSSTKCFNSPFYKYGKSQQLFSLKELPLFQMNLKPMKYLLIYLFVILSVGFNKANAQHKRNYFSIRELGVSPDSFIGGPRFNYMQGKDGFLGAAFNLGWHELGILPLKHFGFAIGSDIKLSNSLLMAPKITLEYLYYFGLVRVGYLCYTDFGRKLDNRISAEIGISLWSFVDLTYVHTFGFNNNPFNLGNDYFNLTISLPLIIKDL